MGNYSAAESTNRVDFKLQHHATNSFIFQKNSSENWATSQNPAADYLPYTVIYGLQN